MTLKEKFKFLWSLPLYQKGWVVFLFVASFLAWAGLKVTTMRKLSQHMGTHLENRHVSALATKKQIARATRMGLIMSMVSNNVPWSCRCLAEALCVKALLNYYTTPSVCYLGAKIVEGEGMKAHAWVTVGPRTIIGGPQNIHYNVVATFTFPDFNDD